MANLVSASLTDETIGTAKTKINELKELLPFLIALSGAAKKRKRTMGQKSVEYVNLGVRAAENFAQYLPQNFNKDEFKKDAALVAKLWEIRVPLAALLESIDDTIFGASSDAMQAADDIYNYLKAAAKRDISAKSHVDEMKKRYERKTVSKVK